MTTNNMPPWDINEQHKNPIDIKMPFVMPRGIFDEVNPPTPQTEPAHINITEITTKDTASSATITTTTTHNDTIGNSVTSNDSYSQSCHTKNIALAIKYRPKLFSELIGQESVTRTLSLALATQRISHAYLFSGLRGSGKTSSARIFARCLQCQKGISSKPCGICPSCKSALQGNNLDIVELDGASNRKIDDIREIIEQTKYKPSIGRFKIFIIDEVHMLTKESFNSLLKTLEEPPSYVKFILATTDPLKVPPTILSRTQHFRFRKIPTNTLKNHLIAILKQEQILYDEASIDMIVRNGHGSVRDTLTLLDQAIIFCQNHLNAQKLADMLGALDLQSFNVLFHALLQKNKQECLRFVSSLDDYEVEMVLDSLSVYIKEQLIQDKIMPVMAMRYANIIADSKVLLQLDCDSDFCLLLTILKMLEAQKIHDIESSIAQLESNANFYRELETAKDVATVAQPTNKPSPIMKPLDFTEANAKSHQDAQVGISTNRISNVTAPADLETESPNNTDSTLSIAKQQYAQMLEAISQRDFTTGEIFEKHIVFEKLDSSFLYLTAYTTEKQNLTLRHAYKGIMDITQHIFGPNIKIKVDKKAPHLHPSLAQMQADSAVMPTNTSALDSVSNNITEAIESESKPPKEVNITENTLQDFMKENQKILGTIKNELDINAIKLVDYK
ncbi:DNA polymerase III subunit gamma/tau [Helicobacter aurati]|uniref:DNA polymerase III subunit gamma/tau n=1 Tax=Helicobacter aurati TaxID=137778 RepID=A0A3D8J8H7_9HELI|nr:DNA polymerase III subunit gamma/tau [Helicobacter aurati]RDU73161.1 DNA polymerase III subunit gamma/tau [Helicobacter aurati]